MSMMETQGPSGSRQVVLFSGHPTRILSIFGEDWQSQLSIRSYKCMHRMHRIATEIAVQTLFKHRHPKVAREKFRMSLPAHILLRVFGMVAAHMQQVFSRNHTCILITTTNFPKNSTRPSLNDEKG